MGSRNVKLHHAKALKTKAANAQQKTLPLKNMKTPPSTAVKNVVVEQQEGEDQIPSRKTGDDRIPSDKNYGEDGIAPQETEDD